MWCLCRKSSNHSQHQSPFSRFRFIVQKSHGSDGPVAGTRDLLRHVWSKRVRSSATSTPGTKLLKPIAVQHPVCPNCDGSNLRQHGQSIRGRTIHRDTNPVETHLMSNFSFVRSALSRSVHRKIACALFQDLLSGAVSSLALTMSLDSKRGPGQCVECPAAPCHVHVEWRFH